MTDGLIEITAWADALLAKLAPVQRRQLARAIALDLRRSQQARIAAQRAPDGTAYVPRKRRAEPLRGKHGVIRRRQAAMFVKLKTVRWLKALATAESAEVGFKGPVARLARVHQEGLDDRATPGGKLVQYPARPLLGFSEADKDRVRQTIIQHFWS